MGNRPYARGVRTALECVGLKTAAEPEMGGLHVTDAFSASTGVPTTTMLPNHEDPKTQIATVFSEHMRHYGNEPYESSQIPAGSNQSMNTKVSSIATFDQLRAAADLPVEPDERAKHYGGAFYERGKRIGYDPDVPDPTNMLAHELGHEEVDKSAIGRILQHPAARALHLTAPTLGALLGMSSRKYGPAIGAGASLLASTPTMLSEGMAHYKGYNKLKELGGSDEQLSGYLKAAVPAMASSVAMPAMGAGLAGVSHHLKFGGFKLDRRMKFRDLEVSIETDKGNYRYWYDKAAQREGKTLMKYPYGYIRNTKGMDGDPVDCFVGPNDKAPFVYVITTNKAPDFKTIDEQKCMMGFGSAEAARTAFMDHYDKPGFFRSMKAVAYDDFQKNVLATQGNGMKMARDTYQVDDRLIDNSPGPTQDQVPGDFLGLPWRTSMLGQRAIVGGQLMGPVEQIDRMFRHHDDDTNMTAMEGNSSATPSDVGF